MWKYLKARIYSLITSVSEKKKPFILQNTYCSACPLRRVNCPPKGYYFFLHKTFIQAAIKAQPSPRQKKYPVDFDDELKIGDVPWYDKNNN